MLFSLLKHYLDTDTTLKVSQSVYRFTTSDGVENYFPRLWGTGISDAILLCSQIARSRRADVGYWSAWSADFADVGPMTISALLFPTLSTVEIIHV